jgi:diadenosine tetraphosphate (Ap4A) HIT family hydrolase
MTDKCHFCRIGAREIGVDVVYEDDFLMAFALAETAARLVAAVKISN